MIPKPHQLSIHPTMQCDYDCFACYLKKDIDPNKKEKGPEFFLRLIEVAKKLGIREVAIPGNYVKRAENFSFEKNPDWDKIDKNVYYFKYLKDKTKEVGLDFVTFVNYDFITQYQDIIDFSDISLMGISINDFVTKTPEKKQEALDLFKKMRPYVKRLNCNILLTDGMVTQLNNGLGEEILAVSDTIYLLMQEPLFVPLKTVYDRIHKLKDGLLTMLESRVFLDSCIYREMGMTGGACSRHDMIYVNPYGEIKMCMYDKKDLFVLEKPEDLEHVYNNLYPQAPLISCDLVKTGDKMAEARAAKKKATSLSQGV
jgi:hypothetical protein